MLITVIITREDNGPAPVAGSLAHAATFEADVDGDSLVQLARDTADAVAVAFLRHPPEWVAPVRYAQPLAIVPGHTGEPEPELPTDPGVNWDRGNVMGCDPTKLTDEDKGEDTMPGRWEVVG
jgi:hypothetical protein